MMRYGHGYGLAVKTHGRRGTKYESNCIGKPGRHICELCRDGDHSQKHGAIGCLAIVGADPKDFVCQCATRVRESTGPLRHGHRTYIGKRGA